MTSTSYMLTLIAKKIISFRLKFDSAKEGDKWYDRLRKKCGTETNGLKKLFAFAFYAWCQDTPPDSPCNDGNLNCFPSRGN